MVLTFDRVGELLDELAEGIPEPFYQQLNGGVLLLPEALPDPENGPDLYILGKYCVDELGRYINIYYGSFAALFFDEPEEVWREELNTTLRHEFTHHVEALAGERSLDRKDEAYLLEYQEEQSHDH